jgi:uncharacterized NAD(P)/FAD-binding protein YdhS
MTEPYRIAIAGGGFSGTLVLANLVAQARGPLAIELFEKNDEPARGVAYGTTDTIHLLNVRTSRMGAIAGEPDHFHRWLKSKKGKAQAALIWPGQPIDGEGYAPRALYAAYLSHLWEEALADAKKKNISVTLRRAELRDAQAADHLTLQVEENGEAENVQTDALVLATGNSPPRRFAFEQGLSGNPRYVPDIWQPAGTLFPQAAGELSPESRIIIIGTGLTTVDAILTLQKHGYPGHITAISRHGHLPAVHIHLDSYPSWEWTVNPGSAPETLTGMVREFREELSVAAQQDYDWRSVVDSLRPVTQALWQRLAVDEKRRFMRRLLTLWNVHRHRMAPDIGAQIEALKASGRLSVVAGNITGASEDGDELRIHYRPRGRLHAQTIQADLLLNCTGPNYDIARSDNALLKNLYVRGLITPSPLGMGLEMNGDGSAAGSPAIFPIGPLCIGQLLECTAVPELRDQAAHVAKAVLARAKYSDEKSNSSPIVARA